MSITGRTIQTDVLYSTFTLTALEDTKRWLENRDWSNAQAFSNLYNILQEMEDETPYQPDWNSSESSQHVSEEEKFKYRRPVWQLIQTAIDDLVGIPATSPKVYPRYLRDKLSLCFKYRQYKTALEDFRERVVGLGLSFHSGPFEGFLDGDVYVQGSFQEKAEFAIKTVKEILDTIIPALTKHNKEQES